MADAPTIELQRLKVERQEHGNERTPCQPGDGNLTSTPRQETKSIREPASASCVHTPPSVKYLEPSRPRLSFGGISRVSPKNTQSRLLETRPDRRSAASEVGDAHPISRLTLPDTRDLTTDRISSYVPAMQGLTLTCHNVTLVENGRRLCSGNHCHPGGENRHTASALLLSDISAYFGPGVNAVMGPSGCGKTTRDGLRHSDRTAIVNDVLASLRLQDCSERKVGFAETSFISGGERKRTAIGMELVAGPKIIFLDEPTTSLDSTMSKHLMKILRDLGNRGRTIILTIHQPSNSLFTMCDNLTLLSHSRLVYHGPASHALDYFTSLGFVHGPHYSRPDFFLDILFGKVSSTRRRKMSKSATHPKRINSVRSTEFTPTYWTTVEAQRVTDRNLPAIRVLRESHSSSTDVRVEEESPDTSNHKLNTSFVNYRSCGYSSLLDGTTKEGVTEHYEIALWLTEKFKMSSMGRGMDEELIQLEIASDGDLSSNSNAYTEGHSASVLMESYLLCKRSLRSSRRLCFALAFMNVIIGLLFGAVYYHPSSTRPLVQNRIGMLFYLSIHGIIVPSMITAKNFVTHEKLLLRHEQQAGCYRLSSYCISRSLILLLARVFSAVLLSSIVYWMTGLRKDGIAFLNFLLTGFLAGLASDTLCLLCVMGHQSFVVGKSIVMMYMAVTSIFAGFLLNVDSALPWFSWIKYVSISRYCYVGWIVGEFASNCVSSSSHSANSFSNTTGIACGRLERSVLTDVVGKDKFLLEQPWIGKCALSLIAVISMVFCYIRIRFEQRRHNA